MALDPNIILAAGNMRGLDYGETMERRAQIGLRNEALAKARREEAAAAARTVRLGQIGTQAAGGDLAGARRTALEGGDFDALGHITALETEQRAAIGRKIAAAAPLAYAARQLPETDVEGRRALITSNRENLIANGWTPEELAQVQPTNAFLDSFIASAQSVGDMIKHADSVADRQERRADRAADRDFQRGNAYISAGIVPPGTAGAGGGAAADAGGGATAGRTQFGWTPRARNGGDNTDAAVDSKIGGMAKALGVDPDAPLTNLTPIQIAGALALSEGGPGSIADRNNNPGNLRDPKTGAYRRFPTKAAGLAAAAAQVQRNLSRGQTTIRTMVEGLPVAGGSPAAGGTPPGLIPGGRADRARIADERADRAEARADRAENRPPAGYRWTANGTLEAIPGGPGDKQGRQANLKPAPAGALTSYQENTASLRQVQNALQLLDPKNNSPAARRARGAIGPGTGALGETFTQWNSPEGNEFRAMIGRIGGIIIKDTSGAAVSASEDTRLARWVPLPTDTPEAARAKLRNLANAINGTQQAFDDIYNEENGYRPLRVRGTLTPRNGGGNAPAPATRAPAVGTVQGGYRFKGGNPASPSSWEKVK